MIVPRNITHRTRAWFNVDRVSRTAIRLKRIYSFKIWAFWYGAKDDNREEWTKSRLSKPAITQINVWTAVPALPLLPVQVLRKRYVLAVVPAFSFAPTRLSS